MKRVIIILFSVFYLSCNDNKSEIIIDETFKNEIVVQKIKIDSVWSGHRVKFSLLTHENRQYIAYYNANRNMVVGQRELSKDNFDLYQMPAPKRLKNAEYKRGRISSTEVGWDSHNSITMAVDKKGYIHLSGNMHVDTLTYFRTKKPEDISTLTQHFPMVGPNELKATYPKFMYNKDQDLIFHYRDGGSGNGNEIYNIYSTEDKSWTRMLDVPLTDGQGLMNAYQSQPTLGPDGWYHLYWVWRDTPDCSTNHDLSYMKSPDLINWYDAFNESISIPATINKRSLIVDPTPPKGGLMNAPPAEICFDDNNLPNLLYRKYDVNGNLQLYIAQIKNGKWKSKVITDWDYRWDFSGYGSIVKEVIMREFTGRKDGFFEVGYWHIKYGYGTILLDNELNPVGKVIKPNQLFKTYYVSEKNNSESKLEGDFPGLGIRTSQDDGKKDDANTRFVLKWETLDSNRDRPREKPWPPPSNLYLYKIKSNR